MARIELDRVSLTFRLRQQGRFTLKDLFVRGLSRQPQARPVKVRALRDLSLRVGDGDRLAVLGHNGAGKSSLLKLLAGVYEPSRGRRLVEGRVSSLFDIALGFEPEATGRENIFYRGYLQGETPAGVRAKLGAIADFSELGTFLDAPVRYYSSGMAVRLAFAIATAVEPEILLIDEVLSVGDLAFQQKARQRMIEMMARARLMVIVSHDLESLAAMCNRAIWLDHGTIRLEGGVRDVIDAYRDGVTDSLNGSTNRAERVEPTGWLAPARWSIEGLPPGQYEVRISWPPGKDRASNAPYRVHDGDRLRATVRVNQRMTPFGLRAGAAVFQSLGRFSVESGMLRVHLDADADGPAWAAQLRVAATADSRLLVNGAADYAETGDGWRTHWGTGGVANRLSYAPPGDGVLSAEWRLDGLTPGLYDVAAAWQPHPNRATDAPFTIFDGPTPRGTVRVNQQTPPTGTEAGGALFQPLGRFLVESGGMRVRVSNDANGYVIADAVHIAPAPSWGPIFLDPEPLGAREQRETACASS